MTKFASTMQTVMQTVVTPYVTQQPYQTKTYGLENVRPSWRGSITKATPLIFAGLVSNENSQEILLLLRNRTQCFLGTVSRSRFRNKWRHRPATSGRWNTTPAAYAPSTWMPAWPTPSVQFLRSLGS